MNKILLLGAAASLLGISSSFGTGIFSEEFAYPNGQLTSGSGGSWVNFSGTANFIQVTDEAAGIGGFSGSSEDVRRSLNSTFTAGSLFASALVTVTSLPTSAAGEYFMAFYSAAGSGGGFGARVFSSTTATGWTFGLSNGTSTPNDWTSDLSLNTQYLIVLKYDVGTRTANMGVFSPGASISESSLTLTGGAAGGPTAGVDNFALRQATASQGLQTIDDIFVGTSLNDVVAVVPVPEPSAWALFGAGLIGLGLVIRRKAK